MTKIHQQVAGTSTLVNEQIQEQTHNGWQSAIIKVEEHARRLSYVEQNKHNASCSGINEDKFDAAVTESMFPKFETATAMKDSINEARGLEILTGEWWNSPLTWAFLVRLRICQHKKEWGNEWAVCTHLTVDMC